MSEAHEFKILVLDPDEDFLQSVVESNPDAGTSVISQPYRRKNLLNIEDILLEHYPDIVVVNLDQDDLLDFAAVIVKIRSIPFANPPIIIGTTQQEEITYKDKAYKSGLDEYLLRPFPVQELWMRLHVQLRNRRFQKQLDTATRKLSALNFQLAESNRRLEELSVTDELTGLFNMRYMAQYLDKTFTLLKRYNRVLTVVMIDLDHFKEVNDKNDHLVGSASIKTIGQCIDQATRKTDVKARYGGDEYIVAMPETDTKAALFVAERIKTSISQTELTGLNGEKFYVTASIGVATYDPDKHQNYREIVKDADRAMYTAKRSGRNQVVCFQGDSGEYDESQSSVLTAIKKAEKKPIT